MVRMQVQDSGGGGKFNKQTNNKTQTNKQFYQCCSGVLLKSCFVSERYTRLRYIHLAFKRRRERNSSLSTSEIKKALLINTATGR